MPPTGPRLDRVHVKAVWRYPIKSLGGEALGRARLTPDGIAGDRIVHVAGERGLVTGRTRAGLLTLPVSTSPGGVPLIAGEPWYSAESRRLLRAAGGGDLHLAAHDGPERFDILNLLVATDGAVAAFGEDVRRLRPNLLIAGVGPEEEATWPGCALAIGDALIGVHSMRDRCVVTTIDPDTGAQDVGVLKRIIRDFDGQLALNCWVITPGTVKVDDDVQLVHTDAAPTYLGGWTVGRPYELHS
jgi:uncharacterized protein